MTTTSRKLTLDDIADLRAYERERDEFRAHVIALKKRRRVSVGPFVTMVFENRDTVRFQIQEMARVERLLSDEAIETELRIYNPLIPDPGHLALTLFIELTSDAELREWLPKLVGIERALVLRIDAEPEPVVVRAVPDEDHEANLTRDDVTASVHYLSFELSTAQIELLRKASATTLAIDHAAYSHATELRPETIAELLTDLDG